MRRHPFPAAGSHPAAALILVFAAVVAAAAACDRPPGPSGDPGAVSAEQFVRQEVDALNAEDAAALAMLLEQPVDSAAVTTRMKRYGGLRLGGATVRARREFPRIYIVSINATKSDGTAIGWQEVLEWNGSTWDLAPLPEGTPSGA